MDRNYWEQLAPTYEEEVFRVSEQDRGQLICAELERLASPEHDVLDVGCGIGLWLPLLSGLFRSVTAVDLAAGLLRRARVTHRGLKNVRFLRRDLVRSTRRVPQAAVVLCVNAVLMPELASRRAMFRALARQVLPGGHLVLVVPSLESALLTKRRLIDWNVQEGASGPDAVESALASEAKSSFGWLSGVVPVDGVPTKHYLREELEVILSAHGMAGFRFRKVEYPWDTEFTEPPDWMRGPYPWDWLVVAKKGR